MKPDRYITIALLGSAFAVVSPAHAEQIFKCTGDDSKVIYQKQPCEKSQIEQQKEINPNRNAVKMEVPPPSEEPKATPPPTAPTTIIRRRGGY